MAAVEAHSYYHHAPAREIPAGVNRMSRALWGVLAGMVVAGIPLIALPAAMIIDRSGTYAAIQADQPELSPAGLDYAFYSVVAFAVALHALDLVLMVWFTLKAIRGRRWARIALTITLGVFTIASAFSADAVPGYLWAIIPSDAAHIVMLFLLWAPRSVRDFYAACRPTAAVP